ncbi:phosphatidylglycerophosphatase A [Szabonella alba]|uniref:Phosphatidylglycerophosphatase A n=1 Tax=Szabonella alba TaxID=2804194 RepID=A0A8K0V7L1_9RHOB|nr:phosphatidylglycerophosphatase A [Szabonella alba]MBL4917214.1 phosphatidylglycerophosphatase A [Szabonella alba]
MSRIVAIFFGVGLLRPAPGTWGSLAALGLGLILHRVGHFPLLLVATVLVTALGFWACARELADRPGEDPSEIVVDEVAGQWIALLFPSFAFWWVGMDSANFPWPGWVSAFLLFRLFDIWKPWLVGRADARGDAAGVMLDDLWAGLFAGLGTMALAAIAHGVLMG